ncbi:MAG: hypothetical protein JXB04_06495 [Kiritimatiellae bacterium]|nr:hypothetical protein [Kiritimatiellia bacterium]
MKRNLPISALNLVALLALFLSSPAVFAWTASEVDFPGDVQGWVLTLDSTKYTGPDGSAEWFRYTATAGTADSSYNFKMVTGNDWNQDYGGNTTFPKNEVSIMWYQPVGDTASLLAGGASNGFRYVFTAKNPGLNDTFISVMELSGDAVDITDISGGTGTYQTNETVTITVTLSTNPPSEQKVYVRYTTDAWANDKVVGSTISSNVATIALTDLDDATTYEWYAFTSTASSNYLANTNDFSIDALTLTWDNNGGANYEFGTPGEAAWMWHNDNRVVYSGSNVQVWVKIGFANGDATDPWITNAAIYYVIGETNTPFGGYGLASNAQTMVVAMQFDHIEQDSSTLGEAMWWVGSLTNLPSYTVIEYKVGAWYDNTHVEHFADYGTSGTNDSIFSFQLGVLGEPELTVDGISADYTTTKFFIDEAAGDTRQIMAVFKPGVSDLDKVEIFGNLDRREYCDVDYTNALIAADGIPDGVKPPEGSNITTNDTGAYFTAWPMTQTAPGEYAWTGTISKCGAYRLTARYTTNGMAANTWHWYSSGGRRDHAVVASPRKALEMTMYELNALTVEATYSDESHRSTFVDLLGAADGDSDGFDPFNLDYLNTIQANCLWFQPIHPNAVTMRGNDEGYVPGSPYATRDYFAVSKYLGSGGTTESGMQEFTNFVAKCDGYTGSVGTINVMLDGVFNHTAWDAEMGQGAVDLGFTSNPTNRIGTVRPPWYSLITDYGEQATYYNGVYDNDFATAPDRGDFGKWDDVCDFYFGKYSALVRHNPDNNGDYLNEDDVYDFAGMNTNQVDIWKYFAYYPEFWLEQTGHPGSNSYVQAQDDKGIDGLRCDFGQGLPPQLWEYIINRTRNIKWNFIFMAETLDGGVPGYRSNRHFDVLNENLVFKFTQEHINDSWSVREALESRRTSYRSGAILLNVTSHDEVLPDNDCWLVATRYGALSAVDGIPMLFYGQEQGIQNYDPVAWTNDGFRTDHEENFGKYIPHFKQWNELTVWSNPPPNSTGLAQWYGRVNWARLNSPALQAQNRYFLSRTAGGDNAAILAVAKYEDACGAPRTSDVVLAFATLFRHGESHALAADTYNLQPAWDLLGLNTGRLYNVRNLASSDASAYVWETAKTGSELYNSGIYVSLGGGTANAITNDGELVQYLKLEEVNQPPVLTVPGPHTLPVGSATNFDVTATDPDGDTVEINNPVGPASSTFDGTTFSWTAGAADCDTSNNVQFVADDGRSEDNSVVTNLTYILVPYDSDVDDLSDGWEWDNFTTLAITADGDEDEDGSPNGDEFVAGTDPNATSSVFLVEYLADMTGGTNFEINVSTESNRLYTIEFSDSLPALGIPWTGFGNTNDGIGTWLETRGSTNYSFVDDFTTNTSDNAPAAGFRAYRVKVRKP